MKAPISYNLIIYFIYLINMSHTADAAVGNQTGILAKLKQHTSIVGNSNLRDMSEST